MTDIQCTNTSNIAVWIGSIATLLAVIVALSKEELVRIWRRPSLQARILLAPPDCEKIPTTFSDMTGRESNVDSYCFRLWIENTGRERAEKVQVFASKLLRRHADGTYKEDKTFLPMNLRWAHQQNPLVAEIFAEGISPKMGKHCDLGKILDPSKGKKYGIDIPSVEPDKTIFELTLEVSPNTKSNLLAPGAYRLELRLAAANAKPVTKTIEINHTGIWYADETKMFSDGIGMREI
jgi:hypothetical protein